MAFNHVRSISQLLPDWVYSEVLVPFGLTRLALIIAAYFCRYFAAWNLYPQPPNSQEWIYSPQRWLDIWGRWDTYWYMDIINHGYQVKGDFSSVQSNIAFFPLYPALIKTGLNLLPAFLQTPEVTLAIGVMVSNGLAIAALILLRSLIVKLTDSAAVAAKSVLYLLLFPTGFFLSCFYTESLFLFLSVLAFWFAWERRWAQVAIAGYFLALTRPQGVFLLIPCLWQYMEARQWQCSRIRADILWFCLIPAGLITFLLALYPLTHSIMAPFAVQVAWGKVQSYPWQTLFSPRDYHPYTTPIDQTILISSFVIAGLAVVKLPSPSYGIYAICLLTPPLFTGIIRSTSRYSLVVFPLFMVLAMLSQRYSSLDRWLPGLFLTIQVLLMVAWSQCYWVA